MKTVNFNVLEKIMGEKVEKLPVGEHKIDLSISIIDNVTKDEVKINTQGFINQGVDYDRTATVSVSIYEFAAAICSQFGIMGDKAAEQAAKAMKSVLEGTVDPEAVKIVKSEIDKLKKLFAETLPKTMVNGRTDIKCRSVILEQDFVEEKVSKSV